VTKQAEHAVADRDVGHVGARGRHGADELVAEDEAGLERDAP
jgi:hypothetical protein